MSKFKWQLNPDITLREFSSGRMENDSGYLTTICGVHRKLWILINCGSGMFIPREELEEINSWLETAFRMGKRMDFRLQDYFRKSNPGTTPDQGQFVNEIPKEVWEIHPKGIKPSVSMKAQSAKLKGRMKVKKHGSTR